MGKPGYTFIQRYEHGLPETKKELAQCVRAYAHYLRRESGQADHLPVDMETIFNQFSLHAQPGAFKTSALEIDGVNLADLGIIIYDSSDPFTRQRYTQAHELMESLVAALRGNQYPAFLDDYFEADKKERLCNWGAALLLMPLQPFDNLVSQHGIGIAAAEKVSQFFQTSRFSTLWHMVNCYPRECGLIIWKRAYKPTELPRVPDADQLALWDSDDQFGPGKKLRVQWVVFGPEIKRLIWVPKHKSIDDDSLIAQAEEGDVIKVGREHVDLGDLNGEFRMEAVPFVAGDETYVLSLVHWPAEMFADLDAQADIFSPRGEAY